MSRESIYSVPYSKIPNGSKIVIYGAGKMGKNYYQSIRSSNRLDIVAILDAKSDSLLKGWSDIPILEPQMIAALKYDYVLIAVEEEKIANAIANELHKYETDEKKIIWAGDKLDISHEAADEIHKFSIRALSSSSKRFFIFMLPEHGNIGDYAIGYSEWRFLNKYFSRYKTYGITSTEWMKGKEFFINLINKEDIVFLNGGGYLGNLRGDEIIYKDIVESFPDNKKVFFPNNLTYKDKPSHHNAAFMKDVKWLKKQKDLHIFLREKNSYDLLSKYVGNCYLAPDMAFILNFERTDVDSNGKVLLCMRDDCEKSFKDDRKLEETLTRNGLKYDKFDIFTKTYISQELGNELLKCVVNKFQKYDCIITDRLHGMILSIVSNVPCIAMDNSTHKISGVYKWIKDMGYALMIDDSEIDNIAASIKKICDQKKMAGNYYPKTAWYDAMAIHLQEGLCI